MSTAARIDELRSKFEENPRRYFAPLANEYRKSGDLTQAIALCREHLPKQPGHMSGHIVFGQALFENGELGEAQQVFEAALALDPENLIALRHLGDIARAQGDSASARRWYERVLDADPRNNDIAALLESLSQRLSPRSVTPVSSSSIETVSAAAPAGDEMAAAALESPDAPGWHTPAFLSGSAVRDAQAPSGANVESAAARPEAELLDLELPVDPPSDSEADQAMGAPREPSLQSGFEDEESESVPVAEGLETTHDSSAQAAELADDLLLADLETTATAPEEGGVAALAESPVELEELGLVGRDAAPVDAFGSIIEDAATSTRTPTSGDAVEAALGAFAAHDPSDLVPMSSFAFVGEQSEAADAADAAEASAAHDQHDGIEATADDADVQAASEIAAEAAAGGDVDGDVDGEVDVDVDGSADGEVGPVAEAAHAVEADDADEVEAGAEAAPVVSALAIDDEFEAGLVAQAWPDAELINARPATPSASVEALALESEEAASDDGSADEQDVYGDIDVAGELVDVDVPVSAAVDPWPAVAEEEREATEAVFEWVDEVDEPADLAELDEADEFLGASSEAVGGTAASEWTDDVELDADAVEYDAEAGDVFGSAADVVEEVVEAELEPDAEAEPEIQAEAEPEAQAEAEPEAQAEAEPEAQAEAEPEVQAEAESEAQAAVDGGTESFSAPSTPAFVTETMAELFVAQGFIGRAVTVYEELVERRPYDEVLSSRLAELQAMAAADVAHEEAATAEAVSEDSADVVAAGEEQEAEESLAEPVAAEQGGDTDWAQDRPTPLYGTTPVMGATPVSSATPVMGATPVSSATPVMGATPVSSATPVRAATPVATPVALPLSAEAGVLTAREVYATLAARRVARRTPASTPAVSMVSEADVTSAAAGAGAVARPTPADGLASLFGETPLPADDVAARSIARAFGDEEGVPPGPSFFTPAEESGETEEAPIGQGAPQTAAAHTPAAGSPAFSFDRFFPDPAAAADAGSAQPPSAGEPGREPQAGDSSGASAAGADLAQFAHWLKGLSNS